MSQEIPIQYRDFYDIPRMFIAEFSGSRFLFDGSFDDAADEYPDEYAVSLLPPLTQKELEGSWEHLSENAIRFLGRVPTTAVRFDPTRRKYIQDDLLRALLTPRRAG